MGACSNRLGYFGKIPTRSDFVKLTHDVQVMAMLDGWLAQVMSRLPADPRWKLYYDQMPPVSFAFVGHDRRHAVAGHLVASHDQSGRRFPFLMMRALEVPDPPGFVAHCPIAFEPLWAFAETMAPKVLEANDATPHLQAIADAGMALAAYGGELGAFLATGTVCSLGKLLGEDSVSRLILALGLLLQPVMHSKPAALHKSLMLPLPEDGPMRCVVASFWLELLTPFVRRVPFDLALFLTSQDGKPVLVVGFSGSAAETLRGIIDPLAGVEQQVRFTDTGWIDEQIGLDIDVRALASYLDQPQLPLRMARDLFLKTFIGAES
ncbi:type VI secretion system-associated protein TagF [Massilia horti]|uniref:Type VI secretion system-associated protein TagF n=1 Tax=Massilia horti TaxID=2562153 RepID=A0A4Y9T2N2_9BURK|nr:type VI secretion system-associated protein TagF [Massilia horti]TFW33379.1 type VI secretion system-associated protein TagF [Massilia horti]